MYSNVHGVAGTVCTLGVYAFTKELTTSIVIGGILGFFSHTYLDKLGEKYYGSLKLTLIYEISFLLFFIFIASQSQFYWLYIVGWIAGNGMDLIDKKLGLSILFPKEYPMIFLFKCHRVNPTINLTLNQTIIGGWISSYIVLILLIIEKLN